MFAQNHSLRVVEPELLDDLNPADPQAVRARRDLRRLNFWMQNAALLARALQARGRHRRIRKIVELGAGDGTLLLAVARRLAVPGQRVEAVLVDRVDLLSAATVDQLAALGWTARACPAEAQTWLQGAAPADVCLCNLFLHHFAGESLRELLAGCARVAPWFIACEPERAASTRLAAGLVRFIGCGQVVRRDAAASVRAGFRGTEISQHWPAGARWRCAEKRAGLFSHLFEARWS